jgi:hypothetical protein
MSNTDTKYTINDYMKELVDGFADAATDLGSSIEAMMRVDITQPESAIKTADIFGVSDRNYALSLMELEKGIKFLLTHYKDQ